MFADRGLVTVRDLPFEKVTAAMLKKFKAFAENPPDACVCVFYFPSTAIEAKNGFPVKSRWATVQKYVAAGGTVVSCPNYSPNECAGMAKKLCARENTELSDADAVYLVELVGTDSGVIRSECAKLCAACGDKITRQDIRELCPGTLNAVAFELTDAIFDRDTDRALGILYALEHDRVEPVNILGALSSGFLDVYRVKVASDAGKGTREVADAFGYDKRAFILDPSSNAGRANRARASRITSSAMRDCLDLLAGADSDLKGGSRLAPALIMRRLVTDLTAALSC